MSEITCHNIPPVKSDYEPIGNTVKVADFDVYVSILENKSKPYKKAIIVSYDIYGFHPNPKQYCDILAKAGFLALLPDYFRGQTSESFEGGLQGIVKFIKENYPTEKNVEDTLKVIEYFRSEYGVENFGFTGFCWGGILGSVLCSIKDFDACVLIHYAPGIQPPEKFEKSQCPIAFLPAAGDVDSQPFIDAMKDKPFADKNIQKRFDDMKHGFAGSRGNLNDELIKKRVDEVFEISIKFFAENVGVKY
ncbi:Alpha/Beta hydrolase protein [Rhizophagus diaphanus]|nr:Alpha/Beta hydrolase protein [Rhizophagus diaphanus] [Rhizophagus sp. MUCL 43196]